MKIISIFILAKRLTEKEKKEIIQNFTIGISIIELSTKFKCTKSTIIRNIKIILGEDKYLELANKFISKKQSSKIKVSNKKTYSNNLQKQNCENSSTDKYTYKNSSEENIKYFDTPFVELPPLNYEIDNSKRKDFSSIPLSDINFPQMVFMVVDKNIELEVKYLKDYPEWQFLPKQDLERKTIEIYLDLKSAKIACKKEQKVIKVPNTNVFKIVSPILKSRGISRLIKSDQLIAL